MLDRGVWGNALPTRTCTITSCLLRFLPSVANPSKMGQSHTSPLFSPSFWDDATLWRELVENSHFSTILGHFAAIPSVRLFP